MNQSPPQEPLINSLMKDSVPNTPSLGKKCYLYGETGHYASQFPKKLNKQPSHNGKHKQRTHVQGRVNYVTIESAQEALDVVFGTCLVNSSPASVLFDSGASHSFIAHCFVKEHNIPKCPMKKQMLVHSPCGDMQATLMCPSVRVEIRG